MFLFNRTTLMRAAVLTLSTFQFSQSSDFFNQKTTVLACNIGGEALASILEDVRSTFPGDQKIVNLTEDRRDWIISQSTADQFLVQNITDPYVVASGEKLPENGLMFKTDRNVPHVTVVGPESSWWKTGTKEFPLKRLEFTEFLKTAEQGDPLEFFIDSVSVLGKWFVMHLKPTQSTENFRTNLIHPYLSTYCSCMYSDIPDELSSLLAELDTLSSLPQPQQKEAAISIAKQVWSKTSTMDDKDPLPVIVQYFQKLTDKKISPYANGYGFWFPEDQYPLASCVISLMKILTPWKAHLSLMPILAEQDCPVDKIIKKDDQFSFLSTPGHAENLKKLNEIIEKYKGMTLSVNTMAISHGGILTIKDLT